MALFELCPNVCADLEFLRLDRLVEDGDNLRSTHWKLKNPNHMALMLNLCVSELEKEARISPFSPIRCPWHQRMYMHIPLNAHWFVWAHPIMSDDGRNHQLRRRQAQNDHISFLTYGGFVYFDEFGNVIKINGIRPGNTLTFQGPFALTATHREALQVLHSKNRLCPVDSDLKEYGVTRFAWVLPKEFDSLDCPLGAFVFEYADSSLSRYLRLQLPTADDVGEQVTAVERATSDLGVQLEFMDQQMHVADISLDSPLKLCGVEQGDMILKWDGNIITDMSTFANVYKEAKFDKAITLRVRSTKPLSQIVVWYRPYRRWLSPSSVPEGCCGRQNIRRST